MINKKGEMGVGTLIVFIAMLIVAAVAAGVLIQTVGSLQSKAISVGSQSEFQISTTATTVEISATDGSDATIEDFQYVTKLAPGSDPIKLNQVTLSLSTTNSSVSYIYSNNTNCSRDVTGYIVNSTNENGTFVVTYIQRSSTWVEGTMQRGDVVRLCFGSSYSIKGDEPIRISFMPKIGTASLNEFVVPDVISTYRMYLFP